MIFRDPAFTPYLPRLVKLVMFSAAVHMACFGTLSRLKFAVGAVQDAGLIFLSAISSSVVAFSREQGVDEAGMLSTSGDQRHWRLACPGQPRGAPASAACGSGRLGDVSLPPTLPLSNHAAAAHGRVPGSVLRVPQGHGNNSRGGESCRVGERSVPDAPPQSRLGLLFLRRHPLRSVREGGVVQRYLWAVRRLHRQLHLQPDHI
ncbi:unnamed protein product [Ectocarpus sp. 13 AM-2016]